MIDRNSIESLLHQIHSGELSLEQATDSLLGYQTARPSLPHQQHERETQSSGVSGGERLDQLVSRLGPPPPDIVDRWCRQLDQVLVRPAAPSTAQTAISLSAQDPLRLSDFRIDADGQLGWNDQAKAAEDDEEKARAIDALRHLVLGEEAARLPESTLELPERAAVSSAPPADRPAWSMTRMSLFAAIGSAAVVVVGLTLGLFFGVDFVAVVSRSEDASSSVSAEGSSMSAAASIDADAQGTDAEVTIEELETLDSLSELEEEIADSLPEDLFSLDSLGEIGVPSAAGDSHREPITDDSAGDANPTPNGGLAPSEDASAKSSSSSADRVESDQQAAANAPLAISLSAGEAQDPNAPPPEESAQPTEYSFAGKSQNRFVELPPMEPPAEGEPAGVQLAETATRPDKLLFPYEVPLQLQEISEQKWAINDERAGHTVASLSLSESGLAFEWTEAAPQSASATLLKHGRIDTDQGDVIYLRPRVEAAAFEFDLSRSDLRPTWDLRHSVAPRVTRLSVQADLPEDIDWTWARVIEPDRVRRAKGSAILQPADSEDVALAVRFDLNVGRKVSCRIRYAARLELSQPWQTVSQSSLEQFMQTLQYQTGLVLKERERLSNVYDAVGTRGKRIIRIKQKRNDSLHDQIEEVTGRVAKLQSMMALLEASGRLQIRVWSEWPDRQQNVFLGGIGDSTTVEPES